MNPEDVRDYVNQYGRLRDVQFATFELHVRKHGLTVKGELCSDYSVLMGHQGLEPRTDRL